MTDFVDTRIIVAEIKEKIKDDAIHGLNVYDCCNDLLDFLNNLKPEKVDLKKEIAVWKYSISKADKSEEAINHYIESIAEYFYRLGKGEK